MSLRYTSAQHGGQVSYTGNIAEWQWEHKGTSYGINTYAFSYDKLARLANTKQYLNNIPIDLFVEKGLTYDKDGNLKTLIRTNIGQIKNSFEYTYTGSKLTTLKDRTKDYSYSYDTNGNMTSDGSNNLNLSYNRLNLIEKVDQNSTTIANYSYLSDGTKLQAVDGSGSGLVYSGSLVYNKQGGNLTLESAAVAGGRIIATGNGYDMHYFLTDHLGSTRVVVNSLGAVVEQSNYYPFGSRWDDGQISDNRYQFNGKESQAFVDVPYLDYGARQYDPLRGTWNGVDFLAEEDSSISPYAYCRNNPIGFTDPTGMSVQASGADSLKVVPINPVVVEARRNNTYSNPLLFIMWSAASWGQMWNNALGNSNASFSQNMYTGLNIWQSFALNYGLSKIMKSTSLKSTKVIQKFKNIDELISSAGKLERLKGGVKQGRITGNIDEIFTSLAQGGRQIRNNTYQLSDGVIITKYSSSTTGVPTIGINKNGQLFKIRIE